MVRAASIAIALSVGAVFACQVPVFRYALERWQPDRYQVTVLSETPLNESQTQLIRELRGRGTAQDPVVRISDPAKIDSPTMRKIWEQRNGQSGPLVVAQYPASSPLIGNAPAHVTPLTADALRGLKTSPVREEIVKRLSDGQSAVWILLESGKREKDERALSMLETQLALDAAWLELPDSDELEIEPEVLEQVRIKLRIEFSVVRVSRDDPGEQFLVDALLNSESDLRTFDEPMAFPVFGRGRVLYALVGAGIATDTIRTASSFVVGPCSCQVKNQNPGFDLMMTCDWEAAIGETFISEPLPTGAGSPTLLNIPPGRGGRK